ncbi:MAG TPA: heavy metal translocating P-type ATPase [Acidimicrobiales bacterium]|nr:heavy metal translocating P-type ATPase [Acidimicrobiales bacterium]
MSHTATCEQDGHVDPVPVAVGDRPGGRAAPGVGPEGRRQRWWWWGSLATQAEVRWAALALVLFLLALAARGAGVGWAADVCFAGCYATGGWEPGLAGLRALRDRSLDVDLLMVVAALVAAGIGQAPDGALLIVIFSTSGALEAVSTRRTREAVTSLLTRAPERASRLDQDGTESIVDAEALRVGDRVVIRPGERIAADGRVLTGASDVAQASITGEPLPVAKTPGDEVFAGTLNGAGALTVEVTRPAAESVVARIVALVQRASETKARTQLFIDRVEQRYSIGMVTVTLALFVVPLLLGAALQPTLLRAMTFMIVASPCAVVLATMPPYLAAIANAGRHGVLVKSAVAMEQLGETTRVAFDKTGTLTRGVPRLDTVRTLTPGLGEQQLLARAAGAEAASEHPLARAVVDAARARDLAVPAAGGFVSQPGRGVTATVDGHRISVSRPDRCDEAPGALARAARRAVAELEGAGRTAVVVTVDGEPAGVLGLLDQVRPDAAVAVTRLQQLAPAGPAVLLTGDNPSAAAALAAEVGIGELRASLLPADKVTAVEAMQADGARVAVVGDGVNDAPALAAAHVGVAMGRHGSDLALETADVVVVRDELGALPAALRLARHARRVVTVNLAFAALVIAALVSVDLAGHLPLPLGVAGHEGSTVVVGLNGLRLLRRRHWRP